VRGFSGRLLTTGWILTELGDGCSKPAWRAEFVALTKALRTSPNVTILPFSDGLFEAGLALYESRMDKNWSLTDCISFVAMKTNGLTDALTGDHHFEQAGFVALLK
jgi:uncharacterized protein